MKTHQSWIGLFILSLLITFPLIAPADEVIVETERTWYSQAQGFIPFAFDPEMTKVPRTPAVWAVDDYIRSTALQPEKTLVQANFRVPANIKKLRISVNIGYRQKGKTTEMAVLTKELTL